MAEFEYQNIEAWNTTIKLAATVGRLKIGSNLKAAADAQANAFEAAGVASAIIAEGSTREGPAQAGAYRDARMALARCRSWLHVLAAVTNEQDSVLGNEFDLCDQAARQLGGLVRTLDRGPAPAPASRGPLRAGPPPQGGPRGQGPRPGGPR